MHSHINHLFALLETAKEVGVPHTYVHFFGDGRDTAPRSASKYAQQLLDFMKKENYGELATIVVGKISSGTERRSGSGDGSGDPFSSDEE